MPTALKGRRARPSARQQRAARIYEQIKYLRGMDTHRKWQHAIFLALTPAQRCQLSLQTARSVLSWRNSSAKTSRAS